MLIIVSSPQLYAVSEMEIKVVFLEKFTHLIEWPDSDKRNSFTICILNDVEFSHTLKYIFSHKTFKNRPVKIVTLAEDETIPYCELLFIGKNTNNVDKVISSLSGKSVLTVSDYKDFISKNVMVTMFLKDKRFNYIINNKAAQDANLKISYLLLKSAQEVLK